MRPTSDYLRNNVPDDVDATLVFVPQWSPFQTALSVPALAAWLRRSGLSVMSVDANIILYEWLLSDAAAACLLRLLESQRRSSDSRSGYRAVIANCAAFRRDLATLRTAQQDSESFESYLCRTYLALQAVESYLHVVTKVVIEFGISPYSFRFRDHNLSLSHIERRVADPHPLLAAFVDMVIDEHVAPGDPGLVGLSCIGQEQLYFTLLFGARVKERLGRPVVVGGTILTRLHERGVIPLDWFGRYFDVVVRNEGERPLEKLTRNCAAGDALEMDVAGIISRHDGEIVETAPSAPLSPLELPISPRAADSSCRVSVSHAAYCTCEARK